MEKNYKKGVLFAALSALSGAYLYVFSKQVLQFVQPEVFCTVYYLFAAIYFTLYLLITGQARLMAVSPRQLRLIAGIGLLESVSVIALFSAIHIMDPTLVSFFNNLQTIFIIMLSAIFLRERFNTMESTGTVISLAGIFLISFHSAAPVRNGLILTLVSTVFFSCTVILVKKSLSRTDPLTLGFYRSLILLLVIGGWAFLQGETIYMSRDLVMTTALGALFGPFLNILFYFLSLRYFDASKTSLIRASQPLFVLANAALLLDTIPSLKEIAGGLVIIAGLFILVRGHEQSTGPAPCKAAAADK